MLENFLICYIKDWEKNSNSDKRAYSFIRKFSVGMENARVSCTDYLCVRSKGCNQIPRTGASD